MGFWTRRETDLERELRARRPQPREQFVQMLRSRTAATEVRRSFAPRIALVAVVTTVLAGSLGAAGAVGYAKSSVKSFGTSVYHIVQSPSSSPPSSQRNLLNQLNGDRNEIGTRLWRGNSYWYAPFQHEESPGFHVFICLNGQIVSVPVREFLYDLLGPGGYHTVLYCLLHRS